MKADYIWREEFEHALALLMPENRLALEISLATGLRIGDVLALRADQIKERATVREAKTGKSRRIRLPRELRERMAACSGGGWVFPHRLDPARHRTRQAVYADLQRAAKALRMPKALRCTPHSARKIAAVELYHKTGDLSKVRALLNHSGEAVTMIYAMADLMTQRRLGRVGGRYAGAQQNVAKKAKK
jgi:integrase